MPGVVGRYRYRIEIIFVRAINLTSRDDLMAFRHQ